MLIIANIMNVYSCILTKRQIQLTKSIQSAFSETNTLNKKCCQRAIYQALNVRVSMVVNDG